MALLAGLLPACAADLVVIEAESGVRGADWTVSGSGNPTYITSSTDGAGGNPGTAARVASYTVTFPAEGTYELYARVRVGAGGAVDDSFFYGNGFGSKSPTADADWILVNSINVGGFTSPSDVVSGNGSAGASVWKWINFSDFTGSAGETPILFSVPPGGLTRTFQIGARENGLDFDKFAFGTAGTAFAVSDLDSGTVPNPGVNTNLFEGPDGIALHRFSAVSNRLNLDGANPASGLARMGGVLVGTTLNGGLHGLGTAFKVSLDGTNFSSLRSFGDAPDPGHPAADLVSAGNNFFTATAAGGSNGAGAIVVGQTNGVFSVLRSFGAMHAHTATNLGGARPGAALAMSGGMLFGTASAAGRAGNGTLFSVTTNGTSFSVLHDFSQVDSRSGTNSDGAAPFGGLVLSGGRLYGTASSGGVGGSGVVFGIDPDGSNFTTLHHFSRVHPETAANEDGAMPLGALVVRSNFIFGSTFSGGRGGRGTLFSLQTNGSGFAVLHHFSATDSLTGTNADGASPGAALLILGDVLYGTASRGGAGGSGTVFEFRLATGEFTVLHSFSALSAEGTNAHGAFPVSALIHSDGSLYGTTFSGGPGAAGTVFAIPVPPVRPVFTNVIHDPNGTVTLHLAGGPNATHVIQSTASLSPPVVWQSVATNVADATGWGVFSESNAGMSRFYRSFLPGPAGTQ